MLSEGRPGVDHVFSLHGGMCLVLLLLSVILQSSQRVSKADHHVISLFVGHYASMIWVKMRFVDSCIPFLKVERSGCFCIESELTTCLAMPV